jgi:probable rRNA maturation factor
MSDVRNKPEYDIRITMETNPFPIDVGGIRTLIRKILRQFEISAAFIDVAVVDDSSIRQLHARYLGRAKITDVISFDLSEDPQGRRCFQILANAQEAARQADRRGRRPQAELALYIVHGLLHNLGYDDRNPAQARRMHRMEDRLLAQHAGGAVYYRRKSEYGKEIRS